MLKKKKCQRCNAKIKDSYSFCPKCGQTTKNEKNYGMLGSNDFIEGMPNQIKLPMGLNTIFNSLMKNLNAEMQNLNQDIENLNFKNILDYLRKNIHIHARSKSTKEIIKDLCKKNLDPNDFLEYLEKKYSKIYL